MTARSHQRSAAERLVGDVRAVVETRGATARGARRPFRAHHAAASIPRRVWYAAAASRLRAPGFAQRAAAHPHCSRSQPATLSTLAKETLMTNQTLRVRLPDLRAETMQRFERRLRHHAQEAADLAQIALQLDLAPVAVDLVETNARVNATRLAILGCAR